jgi:hypothetical protein
MNLSVHSLRDLILIMDEEDLLFLLSSFRCSAEPAAEVFLKKTALNHERNGISRTYVFMEQNESGTTAIKEFFTLAIKCLAVDEHHTIPKEIYTKMNVDKGVAQAYLLGQLAKADGMKKGFGGEMIKRALGIFSKGYDMFGCRAIRLDCKDKMLSYYESFGFILAGKNQNGTLNQMVAVI